ncbi:MAG TPA: DNA-directed RNA polymerase subunit alpha [Oligoflexia bacterium]|nr:DNA-directed RNA polymerase subunit alpha [Oligoflexia bacterium]HMP26473.1 DNA-directed RNA polymerase subunit alpha [Oligoflexia bacterium]
MKKVTLKDLHIPKKIKIEEVVDGSEKQSSLRNYAKLVAEPLERGFGMTVGNSLRRVLLSYLRGAAITSVKIDGVMHEFSSIPGVVEDVTEIVLNLKEVVLRLEDKEEATVRIEASGPCVLTAGMITGDPAVIVVNPDLKIATLDGNGEFKMELCVKAGRGYVPAERNRVEGTPLGTIFIDSIFSPIRRVNYVVSNARVGQRTDYDKLTIEIWTDGSIEPLVAVAQAAHILRAQFELFIGEDLIVEEAPSVAEEPKSTLNENLFKRIEELELSVRSANCLENADIKYIGELVQRSEADMLRTKNFGRKSLNEIKEILSNMGLGLGMAIENFPSRTELEAMRERAVRDH